MKACWMVCLVTALSATSAWAKNAVREATLAKERNNQKSYQAAIDKIVCPAK